jgi:hypothetical protein
MQWRISERIFADLKGSAVSEKAFEEEVEAETVSGVGDDTAKVVSGEVLPVTKEDAPTGPRTMTLHPMSCVLIFDPHRLSVIAPPLGDDPEGEVPPNVALALTCADMLGDREFIKIMFDMWERKTSEREHAGGEGQARH